MSSAVAGFKALAMTWVGLTPAGKGHRCRRRSQGDDRGLINSRSWRAHGIRLGPSFSELCYCPALHRSIVHVCGGTCRQRDYHSLYAPDMRGGFGEKRGTKRRDDVGFRMASRPRFLPEPPPIFSPPPDWSRMGGRAEGLGDAVFCAGAALAALHPIARDEHPLTRLWRERLALASATAIARLQGRVEDEAALRDHLYLTRPGDDPGPAGKLLEAWRALAEGSLLRASSLSADWPIVLGELLSIAIDSASQEAVETALAAGAKRDPIEAAASTAATGLSLRRDNRPLALWLADAALARRLNWQRPVPLLAAHLKREDFRLAGPDSDPTAWRAACARGYCRAATAAFDLYADLARRAERLLAVAPKLRGKDADTTVLQLLSQDAMTAQPGRTTSDRSSRRLFEHLVQCHAVRELTGRPTFRLYGL